jgi:hypothetical protein
VSHEPAGREGSAGPDPTWTAPREGNPRRALGIVTLVACAIAGGGLWLASQFEQGHVRWGDAYRELGGDQSGLQLPPHEERVALANALAEDEFPGGVPGPRLHPRGTLVRLKYETFDSDGRSTATWQVRAVIPPLPAIDGGGADQRTLLLAGECGQACQASVARSGGTLLADSGIAGIASEWVRRMPVGQTYDLGSRSLLTQDILDAKPRQVPVRSGLVGGRSFLDPANIRVTLVDACRATVRVGSDRRLEFRPDAIIPIPRGFDTARWVQMDGCGRLEPFPPDETEALAPASPVERDEPVESTPAPGVVVVTRNPATGFVSATVDEAGLARIGYAVGFRLHAICRYDVEQGWQPVSGVRTGVSVRIPVLTAEEARPGARPIVELPRETALFWLTWSEWRDHEPGEPASTRGRGYVSRQSFAISGPMLCNDVAVGEPPAGMVAACVPFADRAEARFVPDPAAACHGG